MFDGLSSAAIHHAGAQQVRSVTFPVHRKYNGGDRESASDGRNNDAVHAIAGKSEQSTLIGVVRDAHSAHLNNFAVQTNGFPSDESMLRAKLARGQMRTASALIGASDGRTGAAPGLRSSHTQRPVATPSIPKSAAAAKLAVPKKNASLRPVALKKNSVVNSATRKNTGDEKVTGNPLKTGGNGTATTSNGRNRDGGAGVDTSIAAPKKPLIPPIVLGALIPAIGAVAITGGLTAFLRREDTDADTPGVAGSARAAYDRAL